MLKEDERLKMLYARHRLNEVICEVRKNPLQLQLLPLWILDFYSQLSPLQYERLVCIIADVLTYSELTKDTQEWCASRTEYFAKCANRKEIWAKKFSSGSFDLNTVAEFTLSLSKDRNYSNLTSCLSIAVNVLREDVVLDLRFRAAILSKSYVEYLESVLSELPMMVNEPAVEENAE